MLTLFGDRRSLNTRKVLWALEELAAPYELKVVELALAAHRTPDFLALNPNGKVPVLSDDGFVLWESDAILWYLADSRGGLLPAEAPDRASVQQWMSWAAYHLADATYRPRVLRLTAKRTGAPFDAARHAELAAGAPPLLALLDRHLAGRRFVVGDSLTIADLAIAMYVSAAPDEGITLEPFTALRSWHERMTSRPSWKHVAVAS
jgi:glutathione S-transferase